MRIEIPAPVQRASAYWIFPGLVLAQVAGNVGWRIGPLPLGQVLSWANDAAAVALVLGGFPGRLWPYVLVAATLAAKALTIAGVAPALSDLAFDAGLGALFAAAGALIVSERPGITYRQLLLMAVISIPVMVLQMTGVAPWSEAINMEHTADSALPVPTLFVGFDDLYYRMAQARPSGLTHANNFLSLIGMFAFALHFSRIRTPRLMTRDWIIATFALLTMAKVTLLLMVVVVGWKLITGVRVERRRMTRAAGMLLLLIGIYAALFPGLLAANTAVYKVSYSFFVRANDFVDALPDNSAVKGWLQGRLEGTFRAPARGGGGLTGYAQLTRLLPLMIVAGILVAPLVLTGVRRVRLRYPEATDTTVLIGFVMLLYPIAMPPFRMQIYWFIAGFALLPFFTVWEPRRFRGAPGLLWPAPPRLEGHTA
jgi:hypothetical protein